MLHCTWLISEFIVRIRTCCPQFNCLVELVWNIIIAFTWCTWFCITYFQSIFSNSRLKYIFLWMCLLFFMPRDSSVVFERESWAKLWEPQFPSEDVSSCLTACNLMVQLHITCRYRALLRHRVCAEAQGRLQFRWQPCDEITAALNHRQKSWFQNTLSLPHDVSQVAVIPISGCRVQEVHHCHWSCNDMRLVTKLYVPFNNCSSISWTWPL